MKRRKYLVIILTLIVSIFSVSGCGSSRDSHPASDDSEEQSEAAAESEEAADTDGAQEEEDDQKDTDSQVASKEEMTEVEEVVEDWMVPISGENINDGTYDIICDSSSSMFKIESCQLNVENGEMTALMTMGGKGYTYIYPGTGEEAANADESGYISHEENSEGQHTFTIPVEALDQGIDCAAFSTKKEKWYERTLVFRSDSLPQEAFKEGFLTTIDSLAIADGDYNVTVELSGGSGKASIESPTNLHVEGGVALLTVIWSSPNYDYMIVNDTKYEPINTDGNSVYEIPVSILDRFVPIIADTTAMSEPHEISYMIKIDSSSLVG